MTDINRSLLDWYYAEILRVYLNYLKFNELIEVEETDAAWKIGVTS